MHTMSFVPIVVEQLKGTQPEPTFWDCGDIPDTSSIQQKTILNSYKRQTPIESLMKWCTQLKSKVTKCFKRAHSQFPFVLTEVS